MKFFKNIIKKNNISVALGFCYFFLLILITNCSYTKDSELTKLSEIKRNDHEFCISLGLDFEGNPILSEIYYRCRIMLAEHKIIIDATSTEAIRNNILIKNLIVELNENLDTSIENLNNFKNIFIDKSDHNKCLNSGYSSTILDQEKIEKYLNCRKRLIQDFQIIPPFRQTKYLRRPQDSFNSSLVINLREDQEIKLFNIAKESYPICTSKFNIKTQIFKKCSEDFDKQNLCYADAKKIKFSKEMEERQYCQQKLYVNFPKSMIIQENDDEVDRKKVSKSIYNNDNFYILGLDETSLKYFNHRTEDPLIKTVKKPENRKRFNSSDQIYSKVDIVQLRQKYIKLCIEDALPKIEVFYQSLNQKCRSITIKWEDKNIKNEKDILNE